MAARNVTVWLPDEYDASKPLPVIYMQDNQQLWDDAKSCFRPDMSKQAERSAGACAGTFALGDCIREGLEVDAIGFVIGEQQASRVLIPLMSPAVPLSHGILSREALDCLGSFDPHPAFNGFESLAIAELSADSTEIDMGLFE